MSSVILSQKPLRQIESVKELLVNTNARNQLAAVAAKHMNPERMMRVVANAIRTTPKLQQCEPMSFLGALMQCAALNLEPNTILGHAYMIPFDRNTKIKDANGREQRVKVPEVQLVIGYKGLIDLARRSGHITSLSANIHYSDDDLWEYEEGTEARLRHRPGPQEGEKLHAYAIAKFRDGGHAYVVLPWAHVTKIRDASQGYLTAKKNGKLQETPWVKHEDEMAKKTAIRALAKYLPLSVEFMEAMDVDEAKADYRAFAFDPTAGAQIEGEDDTIEGEVTATVADQGQAEAKPATPKRSRAEAQKDFQSQQGNKSPPVARREDAQANTVPVEATMNNADPESPNAAIQGVSDDTPRGGDRAGEGPETAPAHEDNAEDAAEAETNINLMEFPTARTIIEDAMEMGAEAARAAHAKTLDILRQQRPDIHEALIAELDHIGG